MYIVYSWLWPTLLMRHTSATTNFLPARSSSSCCRTCSLSWLPSAVSIPTGSSEVMCLHALEGEASSPEKRGVTSSQVWRHHKCDVITISQVWPHHRRDVITISQVCRHHRQDSLQAWRHHDITGVRLSQVWPHYRRVTSSRGWRHHWCDVIKMS
jgi:hypothetical protein